MNLLPHVVPLSVSLTMSGTSETIQILRMSRLDILCLVLQFSNGFDVISIRFFFQVLFSLVLTVYKGHVQLLLLKTLCSTGIFLKLEKTFSVLFIILNPQSVFRLKHMFSKVPSISKLLIVIMALASSICTWKPCQRQ